VSALTSSAALSLGEWQNFYVLVGSSAGALTGLTFIVITVAADSRDSGIRNATARLAGLRAFITPTAVYFGSSLALSALMSVPGQTAFTLAVCLVVSGIGGLVYWVTVIRWMFRVTPSYRLFLADWIWSVLLPALAYLALAASSALLLSGRSAASLYVIAATTLVLLFIGIHNAWDVVAWMTTERHARREQERAAHSPAQSPSEQSPAAQSSSEQPSSKESALPNKPPHANPTHAQDPPKQRL
jgi:hypothetical protein